MSIDVQAARDAGFQVEYMPPPAPDHAAILSKIYHVLRGTQTALENHGMIAERLHEPLYRSCIEGLVNYLHDGLGIQENTVSVILHAVDLQRAVTGR